MGLAVSTAIFTSTYQAQSRVDVALTVGSDVAVVEPPGSTVGPQAASSLAHAPGVKAVEPLQHRFAYVGPDLQDLYGVRATSFDRVAPLQDAFVPGSTVPKVLALLQGTPDGVLLSAETLHDYQLHRGDLIRIRLQTGKDHAYRPVPFHVLGQVSEWPTAPKDSFIVANADYLTKTTGSDAVGTFLISSNTPAATAAALRASLTKAGSGAQVQDVSTAGSGVTSASGLAATDLSGLSRLVLGFGILLALLASEILAVTGESPGQRYRGLTARFGDPAYARVDAPATREEKKVLGSLSPEQVTATELAGEPITAKLTEAPGNGAKVGGLKVTTESAWFAARPSGTEDVYKIYAESFRGPDHLAQVQSAAREVVSAALAG